MVRLRNKRNKNMREQIHKNMIRKQYSKIEIPKFNKGVSIYKIAVLVSEETGLPVHVMKSKTRKRIILQPRQIVMYFCEKLNVGSLAAIGDFFGKDHATVLHAKKTITNLYDTKNREIMRIVNNVQYNLMKLYGVDKVI